MTVVAVIGFDAAPEVDTYRVTVYGVDGFQPAIYATFGVGETVTDCSRDSQATPGDQFTLPGEETVVLPDEWPSEGFSQVAQWSFRGGELLGHIQLAIGSVDSAPGRYLMVIEGFQLEVGQEDTLEVRLGPWAASTELLVYMVGDAASRLDPYMEIEYLDEAGMLLVCDDVGRQDCQDMPAIVDAGVIFNDGAQVVGDRFDAGLRLAPGDTRRMLLAMRSRARNAHGDYALMVIGELPPREGDD